MEMGRKYIMKKKIKDFIKRSKMKAIVFKKYIHNLFTEHPNSTDNPQGYWEHFLFSFTNSVILMWYCFLGVVHSVFPFVFGFSTSSAIIRSFKKLVESKRHIPELKKYGIPNINFNNDPWNDSARED